MAYTQFRLPQSYFRTIQGFTQRSLTVTYQGQLRRELAQFGYRDRAAIHLQDPAVIRALEDKASLIATSTIESYNTFLQAAIDKLPAGLSNDQAAKALQPFFDTVSQYNRDALVPHTTSWARQQAISDFVSKNGIQTMWTLDPLGTAGCEDECDEAAADSPMSQDKADAYDFPAHPKCPHNLIPTGPPTNLPDDASLWTGQLIGESAQESAQELVQVQSRPYTVAVDLDDSALLWSSQLMPLMHAVKRSGGCVGTISGEHSPADAKALWERLGYPRADFWDVRDGLHTPQEYADWKAAQVKVRNVDLLIDDFKLASFPRQYADLAGAHLGLQLLIPPGIPHQHLGEAPQESAAAISRIGDKFAVSSAMVTTVRQVMSDRLGPEPYDPGGVGQRIETTYFDTAQHELYDRRLKNRDYVTVRLRHYASSGAWFIEAKTPAAKYRAQIDAQEARLIVGGVSPLDAITRCIPDAYQSLARITQDGLSVRINLDATRYSRETDGLRATLDIDAHGEGMGFPEPIFEVKSESGPYQWPELEALNLLRWPISKFLFAGYWHQTNQAVRAAGA